MILNCLSSQSIFAVVLVSRLSTFDIFHIFLMFLFLTPFSTVKFDQVNVWWAKKAPDPETLLMAETCCQITMYFRAVNIFHICSFVIILKTQCVSYGRITVSLSRISPYKGRISKPPASKLY